MTPMIEGRENLHTALWTPLTPANWIKAQESASQTIEVEVA
jgi:hypothetical protein